jgi:hypothetical protein
VPQVVQTCLPVRQWFKEDSSSNLGCLQRALPCSFQFCLSFAAVSSCILSADVVSSKQTETCAHTAFAIAMPFDCDVTPYEIRAECTKKMCGRRKRLCTVRKLPSGRSALSGTVMIGPSALAATNCSQLMAGVYPPPQRDDTARSEMCQKSSSAMISARSQGHA